MGSNRDIAKQIRDAYARRDTANKSRLYVWSRPNVLFTQYRFLAVTARVLVEEGFAQLRGRNCLDVGCGTGGWLRTLMEWGADIERLHGVDLLPDRVAKARTLAPQIDIRLSEQNTLPFEDNSMDLVTAHTVFSSILDPLARCDLASEMMRVARKAGLLLVYDFRISDPRNPDTIGVGRREIRRLFPSATHRQFTLTLAPPLQRPISTLSPVLAHLIEAMLPPLRTHALHVLRT